MILTLSQIHCLKRWGMLLSDLDMEVLQAVASSWYLPSPSQFKLQINPARKEQAAVLLSGGLDSTLLLYKEVEESKAAGRPLPIAYHARMKYSDAASEDLKHARAVCEDLAVELRIVTEDLKSDMSVISFFKTEGAFNIPHTDLAAVLQLKLLQQIKADGLTTVIDGIGADGVFGTSCKHRATTLKEAFGQVTLLSKEHEAMDSALLNMFSDFRPTPSELAHIIDISVICCHIFKQKNTWGVRNGLKFEYPYLSFDCISAGRQALLVDRLYNKELLKEELSSYSPVAWSVAYRSKSPYGAMDNAALIKDFHYQLLTVASDAGTAEDYNLANYNIKELSFMFGRVLAELL